MLGHQRRWIILSALTILAMICALATAGHALHHREVLGVGGGWDAAALLVIVAIGFLIQAVRRYRRSG